MSKQVLAAGPFFGELGWEAMGFSGYIRYLKSLEIYRNTEFVVMTDQGRYPLYHSFIDRIIPLPSWYKNLGLEPVSYDAIGMNPELYSRLIKYMRRFYYDKEFFEVRPPRGHTFDYIATHKQAWERLKATDSAKSVRDVIIKNGMGELGDTKIIVVMPRYRVGVSQNGSTQFSDQRNWHPAYWQEVINYLKEKYLVVVAGTKNGIPPIDYSGTACIPYIVHSDYIMDITIAFMEMAIGTICSQSGGTHISLQAKCPTWVLGHERQRHAIDCNPLKTPCAYLETGLPYYQVIPEQAIPSIDGFIEQVINIERKDDV